MSRIIIFNENTPSVPIDEINAQLIVNYTTNDEKTYLEIIELIKSDTDTFYINNESHLSSDTIFNDLKNFCSQINIRFTHQDEIAYFEKKPLSTIHNIHYLKTANPIINSSSSVLTTSPDDTYTTIDNKTADCSSIKYGHLLGSSPAMHNLYNQISRVAPTTATVLIVGDSGTGKELVAQTIHEMSTRRNHTFLPVNCGAISPQLIESEMFGHEKGSFTGATRDHKGYFERAHNGTLFLDEITEMPLDLQVKLLRVLETGFFMRVGSDKEIETNIRIIAATNRIPEEAVATGKLREDLLYRLQVFPIEMPPLRERDDDITLLAQYFLDTFNRAENKKKFFSPAAIEALKRFHWPGNVRELRNAINRAYIMANDIIDINCLPKEITPIQIANGPNFMVKVGSTIAEIEKKLILATLIEYSGNKEKASEALGISLKTLYNRLHQYGINDLKTFAKDH